MEERKFKLGHQEAILYRTINGKSIMVFSLDWNPTNHCCGLSELGRTNDNSKETNQEDIIFFFRELKKAMQKNQRLSKKQEDDFDDEFGLTSQMIYTIPFETPRFQLIYKALSKTRNLVTKTRKFYNPNSGNNLITYILTV